MISKLSRRAHRPPFRTLSLGFLLLAIGACQEAPQPSAAKGERVHLVETATVRSDSLSVVRTRTGTLRALREVQVFTQEEGRITALPFYAGDRVKQGEVVVRLDDTLIRAQLSRATATRKQADQNLTRLEELRTRKLVSEDEYARAITQLEVAEADERVLDIRLGYMTIRSPIAGVISARLSEPGNVVERHDHVLTISDPSSLVTELPVSELILPRLRVGDRARVRIDALGDQVYEGLITRIYPTLDPVSRRGTIEVELQPVPEGAAPGQLCRVELATRAAQRRVIPFSALRRDEESEYVFVLDADGKAQRVNVKSGLRLAEKIEITEGLEDGQQVITRGFLGLTSGKKVKPVESGPRGPLSDAG
jgi:membrane fusion protein (multidrug efflux system)